MKSNREVSTEQSCWREAERDENAQALHPQPYDEHDEASKVRRWVWLKALRALVPNDSDWT